MRFTLFDHAGPFGALSPETATAPQELAQWGRQLLRRRWLPERSLVLVADNGYAAWEFLVRLLLVRIPGQERGVVSVSAVVNPERPSTRTGVTVLPLAGEKG